MVTNNAPAMRAYPKGTTAATMLQAGRPCNAKAPQTRAAAAAVAAVLAQGKGTATAEALHAACHTCNPPDPQWLGYAIKAGWVTVVPAAPPSGKLTK